MLFWGCWEVDCGIGIGKDVEEPVDDDGDDVVLLMVVAMLDDLSDSSDSLVSMKISMSALVLTIASLREKDAK